jgi:hypothetical protein
MRSLYRSTVTSLESISLSIFFLLLETFDDFVKGRTPQLFRGYR